jgi:thiosulfate/3-mercaptopyruvate sulfurtransferase
LKTEKLRLILFATLLLIFFTVIGISKSQDERHSSLTNITFPVIVSTSWISEHMKDSDIVFLHISSDISEYSKGHIPEARFLSPDWLIESTPAARAELPPINKMTDVLNNIGISNKSRIILYGSGGNLVNVARIFATLEYNGLLGQVSILNGGKEAWIAGGGQLLTETPVIQKTNFIPKVNNDVFVSAEYILMNMGSPDKVILDTRAPEAFFGEAAQPRTGHIPGAVNLNSASLIDSKGMFLETEKLKEIFTSAGLKAGTDLTLYCYIGQSTCIVYTAARLLGYPAHVYDGSFEEWSSIDDLPLEVSSKPADQTINIDSTKEKK